MQSFTSDILIVGGGIVGLTLAAMLAQKTSLSITLLEAHSLNFASSSQHYHHRVSALALSSQRIFNHLQIWETLKSHRVSPFLQMEVWDAETKGEISFDSREMAEPALGFIVENTLIQQVLVNQLKASPQVTLIDNVKLARLINGEQYAQVLTDSNQLYEAPLIVAADGAHSFIREQAPIAVKNESYQQTAIVAEVETALPHRAIARQIFLPTGPLAFLPLIKSRQSSIVWSLPTHEALVLLELDDEAFQHDLGKAFEYRLGDVEKTSPRYAFPLYRQQAVAYQAGRIALVGESAHTVHPLAGQGVNMGLLDAASLVDVISTALAARKDIGSFAVLRRYERWRKADNTALIVGINKLKQLFASEQPSVQTLRSTGLRVVNRLPLLKNLFARYAVGDRDNLPSFASTRYTPTPLKPDLQEIS